MAEHTKGPWFIDSQEYGFVHPYIITTAVIAGDDEAEQIAEVEQEADSRLIAAAPDLLEAAEYAVEHLHLGWSGDPNCESCTAIGGLREAIAKARGDAS